MSSGSGPPPGSTLCLGELWLSPKALGAVGQGGAGNKHGKAAAQSRSQSLGAPHPHPISALVLGGVQSGRWRQFTNSQGPTLKMASFHLSLPMRNTRLEPGNLSLPWKLPPPPPPTNL